MIDVVPSTGNPRSRRLRPWRRLGLIASLAILLGFALYLSWPRLTGHLRVVRLTQEEVRVIEKQREPFDLNNGDRIHSPDGSMYVAYWWDEVKDRDTFSVFDARSGRLIGRFAGKMVLFRGWAEDSSGFYVNTSLPPGFRSMTWMSGGWAPVRKVRVPGC